MNMQSVYQIGMYAIKAHIFIISCHNDTSLKA